LGHENEATTERHYGKLSDERRCELFEEMGEEVPRKMIAIANEYKIALMDELLEKLGLSCP
jgi:hypothetical protein